MYRAPVRNFEHALTLIIRQVAVDNDLTPEFMDLAVDSFAVTAVRRVNLAVSYMNRRGIQRKLLVLCVHLQGHRRARRERSAKQIVG